MVNTKKLFGKRLQNTIKDNSGYNEIEDFLLTDEEKNSKITVNSICSLFKKYEIEDYLYTDEKIIWQGEEKMSQNASMRIVIAIICFVFFCNYFFVYRKIGVLGLIALSPCFVTATCALKLRRKKKYAITNFRVIILDNIEILQKSLEKLTITHFDKGLFGNLGCVLFDIVSPIGGKSCQICHSGFKGIKDFESVYYILNEEILRRKKRLA